MGRHLSIIIIKHLLKWFHKKFHFNELLNRTNQIDDNALIIQQICIVVFPVLSVEESIDSSPV
jgi:hypothetical protein